MLYGFKGPPDGQFPAARLTAVTGMLYGTTPSGGKDCDSPSGYYAGTIFEFTLSGAEKECILFNAGHHATPTALFRRVLLLPLENARRHYGSAAAIRGTVFA